MAIPVRTGDYLIVEVETDQDKTAKHLVQALRDATNTVKAVMVNALQGTSEEEILRVEPEQVIANLGANPAHGKVYGIDAEPFHQTHELKRWGTIHRYRDLSKTEIDFLIDTLAVVGERLHRYEVDRFMPVWIEVRPPAGKYAGSYHFQPRAEMDKIIFKPPVILAGSAAEEPAEDQHVYTLAELAYHESGHGVWCRQMPERYQARWVRMYYETVTIDEGYSQRMVERIGEEFVSGGMTTRAFSKTLPDDSIERKVFKECLGWIKKTHHLLPRHLDTLILDEEDIRAFWPKAGVIHSEVEQVVTDYARKNAEEFFCETFAFWGVKNYDVPGQVMELMERTLERTSEYGRREMGERL